MVSGFKMSRFPALLRLRDLDVVELPRASRGGIGECAMLAVVGGGQDGDGIPCRGVQGGDCGEYAKEPRPALAGHAFQKK